MGILAKDFHGITSRYARIPLRRSCTIELCGYYML